MRTLLSAKTCLNAAPRAGFVHIRQLPRPPRHRNLRLCASSSQALQPGVRRALAVSPHTPTDELAKAGSKVLLLGEGDFSFCRAAARLHSGLSFTATSFETEEEVRQKWGASAALDEVRTLSNVMTMHGIDATRLDSDPRLLGAAFDRVLFTFPHCGVKGQIHRNRALLAGFSRAVRPVLAAGGQAEVTLAKGQGGTPLDGPRAYGDTWQVQLQAAEGGLVLSHAAFFESEAWRELGYSSRGCYRGLGRGTGTMEVGFRTLEGVVHTLVPEDGRISSPYPFRQEFDMSLWVAPEWGIGNGATASDAAVARFVDAVRRAATDTAGAGVVEDVSARDIWCRSDGRLSLCLRVTYCAPKRALTHAAAVAMHDGVRAALPVQLGGLEIRVRADALSAAASGAAGGGADSRQS